MSPHLLATFTIPLNADVVEHANGTLDDFTKRWKETRGKYVPLIEDRGMILEWGGHHLPALVPRELFKEHPEYFRMNETGERTLDFNFCPNSGAMEITKESARKLFAQLPEVTYFCLYADDLMEGGWCRCPKCMGRGTADSNMLAMNAIAEVLAEVNPKAHLAVAAYHDYERVSKITPAKNLFLQHGPRERCYTHAFNDPKCRRNAEEYMPPWDGLRAVFEKTSPGTIHTFQYYTDGILNREMQPPFVDVIPADARYFRSVHLSVFQNLMVAFREWQSPPFSLVNFARAAWNADVNGWDVLDDFCSHYYGEPIKSDMLDYYRKVEQACSYIFDGDPIQGPFIDMTWPPTSPEMRRPKIEDVKCARAIHTPLGAKLDAIIAKTPEGIIKKRLELDRKVWQLHQDLIEFADYHFEGQFLAEQYINGTMEKQVGEKSVELLDQCLQTIEKLKPLNQGYYSGYIKPFTDLRDRVKEKLAKELSVLY